MLMKTNSCESGFQLGGEKQPDTGFKGTHYTSVDNKIARVSSLGSSIGRAEEYFFKDANKSPLGSKQQMKFSKLRKFYHDPGAIKGKETDYRTLKILDEVLVRLQLPKKTQDRSRFLYREYKDKYKGKIANHVLLSAVCVFQAIRENKCPTTLKDLVTTYQQLKHRVYARTIIKLKERLEIRTSLRRS